MREVLEFYEQGLLNDVLVDNGHDPVGDVPEILNQKHVIGIDRWNDSFGGGTAPGGSSQGDGVNPILTEHDGYEPEIPGGAGG